MATSVRLEGFGLKSSDVAAIQAIIEAYQILNPGVGASNFGALTGNPTDNANLAAALLSKMDIASQVVLPAGPTAITRAAHANRDVVVRNAGITDLTFAATATSGAQAGDFHTIYNDHTTGYIFAIGAVVPANRRCKTWAGPGEALILRYDPINDRYICLTPFEDVAPGTGPSCLILPQANNSSSTQIGVNATTAVDSSTSSARAITTTSLFERMQRVGLVGAGGANRGSGMHILTNSPVRFPPTNVRFNYRSRVVAGVADANAAGFTMLGSYSSTVSQTLEPNVMLNTIMLAGNSGYGQMRVMSNGGSGVADEIVLNGGTGFANNTDKQDMFDFFHEVHSDGLGNRFCVYTVRNQITNLAVSGRITGKLPADDTALWFGGARGSMAGTLATNLDFRTIALGAFA